MTVSSILYKPNHRAKRLILKYDERQDCFIVTLPPRVTQKQIDTFLEGAAPWMKKQNAQKQDSIPFFPTTSLPILGVDTPLTHKPCATQTIIECRPGQIVIQGPKHTFSDQCHKALKTLAAETFLSWCHEIIALLPKSFLSKPCMTKLTIRDPKTRWGSCSSAGALSLSWRLIFAPREVAYYVCVHECAHLLEMNHSPKFWSLVAAIDPKFQTHRQWLKDNGKTLFLYGIS